MFNLLKDIVTMPIRVAVDAVSLPSKIVNCEDDLLESTVKGLKKIKEDLDN